MKPLIKTDNLVYEYTREEDEVQVRAVDGVNLTIEEGSFTAVIGRNGSGKSTIAKNFNGLLLPSGGKVYVAGMDTADDTQIWNIRQTVGMVFQNPDNQLVSSVVEDDVAFGPENLGVAPAEIRKRVDDALTAVHMYDERKKAPHMLSGGQKQRIAIAGVVAMRPRCILLDEPTAMLDPTGRAEVMKLIHQFHDEGITIVLITHFMEEAAEADRIILMDAGKVVMDAPPHEIFAREEEIRALSLSVPFAVKVASGLRERGAALPANLITNRELADYLIENREELRVTKPAAYQPEDLVFSRKEAGKPIIQISHLTHFYNEGLSFESKALDDVSLEIEEGSFAAFIGHTGSGKSTLIQTLNGLLKPKSGQIIVDGVDVTSPDTHLREVRKKVGLVFQYPEYQLFEETVAKDIAFGPKNLGLSEDEINERVHRAMELVNLDYETYAERSPFELSGGQKRRVAIAGVLAMKPRILILDEPVAGLDPESRRAILALIDNLRKEEHMTILLVSHNMGDVAKLADRVFVMNKGKLAMSGTPEEIFSRTQEMKELRLGLPPAAEFIDDFRTACALAAKSGKLPEKLVPAENLHPLTLWQAEEYIANWLGGEL